MALGNFWDPASAIPTLIGSLLSMVATFSVIVLTVLTQGKKTRDFRFVLILQLTIAEFINSLNGSISGLSILASQAPLQAGASCNLNGWVSQISVQAIDFSILAISIITLLIIQLRSCVLYASFTVKTAICCSIWVVPLITSFVALFKGYYGPVSGNWCWIHSQFGKQRYILTHGWRLAILLVTTCIYVYALVFMLRRFKPSVMLRMSIDSDDGDEEYLLDDDISPPSSRLTKVQYDTPIHPPPQATPPLKDRETLWAAQSGTDKPLCLYIKTDFDEKGVEYDGQSFITRTDLVSSNLTPSSAVKAKIDREVWQIMILGIYPITYLILWIPGFANRISSTQFIGFVNALLVLYKEYRSDMKKWLHRV